MSKLLLNYRDINASLPCLVTPRFSHAVKPDAAVPPNLPPNNNSSGNSAGTALHICRLADFAQGVVERLPVEGRAKFDVGFAIAPKTELVACPRSLL